jgi:hypothetical protein
MSSETRTIRTLSLREIESLIDWAAAEGWNPGLHDAAAFQAADPQGFLGAFVNGQMVAGISAVAFGDDFGFIGLYICRPDKRGQGHGKAVWDAAMNRLSGRTIGLDGVDEQLQNYARKGFVPSYRTIRFGGRTVLAAALAQGVHPVAGALPSVARYDGSWFPADRLPFLKRWLAPPHNAVVRTDDDKITGYGVLRQCREGYKIGGLFADSEASAISILESLASSASGNVYIDVPAYQTGFIDFLVSVGLTPGFETTRMYLGHAPASSKHVFAITTLELG